MILIIKDHNKMEKGLTDLPDELLRDIFLNVEPRVIEDLCKINKKTKRICDDDFWEEKFAIDFPILSGINKKDYNNALQAEDQALHVINQITDRHTFSFQVTPSINWLPDNLYYNARRKKYRTQLYQINVFYSEEINLYVMYIGDGKQFIEIDYYDTFIYLLKFFYYTPKNNSILL